MRKRISLAILVVALFVIVGGLSFALNMYFDWLWFAELDKSVIFTTIIYAKGTVAGVTILLVFLFLYVNLWVANKSPGDIKIGFPTTGGQVTAYTFSQEMVRRVAGGLSLVVGLLVAIRTAEQWELVWRWVHSVDFGRQDPIFARDISFYLFSLPVAIGATRLGLILCGLGAAGAAALYYSKGSLTLRNLIGPGKRSRVGYHLSFLAALFFLLLAASAYLSRYQMFYFQHDLMSGASYADLNGRLPLLTGLAAAALIGSLLLIYNAFSSGNRAAIAAGALYVLLLIVVNIYPAVLQRFLVSPNELSRESQQIEHNIEATLHAYALDDVEDRHLSGDKALTRQDIQANAATIRSVRLWDHEPLLDAFSQIQEIRTYYDFNSVDNDRYSVNGVPQQMMLSPRELNSESLPERNWINEHLRFTHGYGLTLGPVNRVTPEGLPVLLVQDIPPRTLESTYKIDRPEIYFGELTKGYVIVETGEEEFDYPSGEENVSAAYAGSGGVAVNSLFRKLLFAFYFRDPNIVLSPLLKADSRFLYFRDIRTRFGRLAPYLLLDQDPYMVISEGRLYWIQDAYTTSDSYPYSTPTRGVGNYIRNSVKMVMDAYNGTVDLYIADPEDRVIQVYQRIFPDVYKPISEMPEDLQRHVRYPEDIFTLQTYIYSIYHMENPQIFYNKEDLWEIPVLASTEGQRVMSPYFVIMRLPQEEREEFILMLPFTPARKDNLSAWMVARSDGEHYGKLVVYRFPKQKLIFGPKQIIARINQEADISRQLSLWDQRGSQVIQGTLLVIPIEEGLIYVRPLYIRAETGKIPELKRVIVAYENKIAMEETLEASLERIFGGIVPGPTNMPAAITAPELTEAEEVPESSDILLQAKEVYDRALQARRQGDWASYGEEIQKLGVILNDLQKSMR